MKNKKHYKDLYKPRSYSYYSPYKTERLKANHTQDLDSLPNWMGISRKSKHFFKNADYSVHSVKRWLLSNIGRHIDCVYSDWKKLVPRGVKNHHFWDWIIKNEDIVFECRDWPQKGKYLPYHYTGKYAFSIGVNEVYVDNNGILQKGWHKNR